MSDAKAEKTTESSSDKSESRAHHVQFYDPYKESRLTRLGLNFESFKRAPGTTAYVVALAISFCSPRLTLTFVYSGQVVAGSQNVHDLERILADSPMLQQKMKPRHLTMIAVGESIVLGPCPRTES